MNILRPCSHPGCTALTTGARCTAHVRAQRAQSDARRKGSPHRALYNSTRWREYSRAFLAANPICLSCDRGSQVCDHITPHRGNLELFWDASNHQPLCKRCHDKKTAKLDGGFGRKVQNQAENQ